jgi:very-short-patch-repair endonuclease
MSDGEELLAWQLQQVHVAYVREFRFYPGRQWRFDFAIREGNSDLAVEVDGGTWGRGRHTSGAGFEADCEKFAMATIQGWRVLRVTPAMVEDGRALAWIERAIGR